MGELRIFYSVFDALSHERHCMFLFYGNNSKTESVFAVASAISCGIKYTEKYLI